jgi:hypothetical protein
MNAEFQIQQRIDTAFTDEIIHIPSGTYQEDLIINKSISLVGEGDVFIEGTGYQSVLSIDYGTRVNLCDLNILHGRSTNGGGIKNQGQLNVTHSVLQDCTAPKKGGLIYNEGTLRLQDSVLKGGHSRYGGGIYNEGKLLLDGTLVISNHAEYGGGIYNTYVTSMAGKSQVSMNSASKVIKPRGIRALNATCAGGGVYNSGKFLMENSTIRFNTGVAGVSFRGFGVFNSGKFFFLSGDLSYNLVLYKPISYMASSRGGGFYNVGELVIQDGVVKLNSADLGGGICNRGDLWLENGSITKNSANDGGGIYNKVLGFIVLDDGEITENKAKFFGGGIRNRGGEHAIYGNKSIVFNNVDSDIE